MEGQFKTSPVDQLVKFIEDNQVMFWSHLDVEIQYNSYETILTTGIPHALFNGILRSQYTTKNINDQIAVILEHFQSRNVPFTWWVSHRSSPKDLGDQLLKRGLVHIGVLPTMVGVIQEQHAAYEKLPGFEVQEVQSEEDMGAWGKILAEAFNVPGDDVLKYCSFFPKPAATIELQHFIGIFEGKKVAAATLFLQGQSGGLYNIAVVPSYRCRGIGTNLTQYLLKQAHDQQCKLIAMQSYPIVVDSCIKLGFKRICDYNVYTNA